MRIESSISSSHRGSITIIPIKGEKYTVNQEHILCLKMSGFPEFNYNNHAQNTNYNVQWIQDNRFCSKKFTFNESKNSIIVIVCVDLVVSTNKSFNYF